MPFFLSPYFGALLLVGAYYCVKVFTTVPFLQHEIVGPAFWWTQPGFGFFETLFDGEKMDGGPGRFRYVEYLSQAFYWKGMANGLLPYDLYDFFGFVGVFVCAYFLIKTAKAKGLLPLEILLCVSFFLLSTNAFLISVFHYRKARSVFAILFALLFWVAEWKDKGRLKLGIVAGIGFIGFFSDPFFVLTAPVLLACLDWEKRNFKRLFALLAGMGSAFLFMLILNGVIGPYFNSNSAVVLFGFKSQEALELLNLKNIPAFPRILKELLIPGYITEPVWTWRRELGTPGVFTETTWIGWALLCFFLFFLMFQIRQKKNWGLTVGLLITLPLCSYLIIPISTRSLYSGYYGYPYIVLVTVLLMNFVLFLKAQSTLIYRSGLALILLLISFHQLSTSSVYTQWVEHYLFPIKKELYFTDYKKLKDISEFLKNKPQETYNVYRPRAVAMAGLGQGWYGHSSQNWTELSDIIIPIVFRKKAEEGRVAFVNLPTPKKLPPRHILWSDVLRYPYHWPAVPKGTLVDLNWVTSNATKCRALPTRTEKLEELAAVFVVTKPTLVELSCESPGGTSYDAFVIDTL